MPILKAIMLLQFQSLVGFYNLHLPGGLGLDSLWFCPLKTATRGTEPTFD